MAASNTLRKSAAEHLRLFASGEALSASDVGVTYDVPVKLAEDGLLVQQKALRKTGSRGRPARVFKITSKGRKALERFDAAQEQAQA